MTDTPRTDALCPADDAVPLSQAIPLLQLCRTIERDLAEARRERDEARSLLNEDMHSALRQCQMQRDEARQMADTYKARCHALEHAVAATDARDEEDAQATLRLIHERDEARRDAVQLLEFSKHAYYAMNDAYNVLVTCIEDADTSDETKQLEALTERLCDLCFQAFTLNGVNSKAQLDAAKEAK